MNQNIKIAVIGGSGKAGRYLIKHLTGQNYQIRALTRSPHKIDENGLIEKVDGDVTDYDSVHRLIEGCNVLISTLGQSKGEKPVFSTATMNIVRAMEAFHLKRYIVLTGLTLDTESDKKGFSTIMKSMTMKLLFRRIILDKQNEYKILKNSNLDWTIVRVPFIEVTDIQKEIETSLTDCRGSGISSASLAGFLTDQINNDSFIRKAPFAWSNSV